MTCARNIVLYKRRWRQFAATLQNADGTNTTISSGDNIRLKIGRPGFVPTLEVDYRNPTANGSQLTLANPTTVTLRAADVGDNFRPGIYTLEFVHVDDAGNEEPKTCDVQFAVVHESQLGPVSIDEESSSDSSISSSSSSS